MIGSHRIVLIRFCLFLIVVSLPGASLALEGAEKTATLEHDLDAGSDLVVENLLGSVRVVPSEATGVVRVDAHVVGEAKTEEEAAALVESIRLEADDQADPPRVRVVWPVDRCTTFRPPKSGVKGLISRWTAPILRGGSTVEYDGRMVQVGPDRKATGLAVQLTVALPYDATLTVRQSVGAIEARALRGRLHLETVDGDISVERSFGRLEAESERGAVRVSSFQGDALDLRTVEGDVELTDVRVERVGLRTESGAIRSSGVATGTLTVESADGDVKLGGFEPTTADVRTGSGKIDLATHMKTMRSAVISTATGDVTLRVGELTHFDLLAESRSGEVKTLVLTLDPVGREGDLTRLRHGQGGPELSVSALGGSVTVRPYDGSRLDFLVRK
jgi:hypothetical protein